MAAFSDLWPLRNEDSFIQKVAGALVATAIEISVNEPENAKRFAWAARVVRNPEAEARAIVLSVAVGQKGEPIESIKSLDDATIQAIVASRVDLYAEGIA